MNIIKRWSGASDTKYVLVELPPSRRTVQVDYGVHVAKYFVPFPWMYFLIAYDKRADVYVGYKMNKNDGKYYVFPIGRNINKNGDICYGCTQWAGGRSEDIIIQKCVGDFFEIPFERAYLLYDTPVIPFSSWEKMEVFPDVRDRCFPIDLEYRL